MKLGVYSTKQYVSHFTSREIYIFCYLRLGLPLQLCYKFIQDRQLENIKPSLLFAVPLVYVGHNLEALAEDEEEHNQDERTDHVQLLNAVKCAKSIG